MTCCPRCQQRGKTWNGDDPVCAFPGGVFIHENWNCATANALRDLCADEATVFFEEQHACILPGVEECEHVVLTWYKRRGRTDGAWMLYDDQPPKPLTLQEAERIILAGQESET